MKDSAKEKVKNELTEWTYLNNLKENIDNFVLRKEFREYDEIFRIFSYENKDARKSIAAYFHDETMEYKLSVTIGLINFCDVSFFAQDIKAFENNLNENLEKTITSLAKENNDALSSLIKDKKILTWNFEEILPQNLEGFSLFLSPKFPVLTINGSYIIFNYVDFDIKSDFTIYYNIFRDEFFGESHIAGTPTVTYDFDSKNISELEKKLKNNMVNYLKTIRSQSF